MKTSSKLSSEERRAAIIHAVRRVFAEKGFHGTTTRELAEAAEVSEALLFKHFPNKEALYSAMMLSCCSEQNGGKASRLNTLEPSASTLVCLVHLLVSHLIAPRGARDDEETLQNRLLFRSMTEDGEFARMFFRGMPAHWNNKVEESLAAAVAAGDAVAAPVKPAIGAWFIHHLAGMIMLHLQPAKPITDYGMAHEKLVEQVVWFALRGLGLKDETIKRHYNPKALNLFAE
jgi:AcrR family transcriptional regulator